MRKIFILTSLLSVAFFGSCVRTPNISYKMECNSQSLGVYRTINLKDFVGHNFGGKNNEKLPLNPYEVVLTFDDGPDENVTSQVLDALKGECTRATFFMVGNNIAKNPDMARKVAKSGHSIGLHSISHLSMRDLSNDAQIKDYEDTLKIAKHELGNNLSPFYRYPFLHDTENLTQYLNKNGVNIFSVDAVGYDWEASATNSSILNNVFKELDENNHSGIILLHDIQKVNIEAVPLLLKELKARNYHVVALNYKN